MRKLDLKTYFVDYTWGDHSRIIGKAQSLEEAKLKASEKLEKYNKKQKGGIITIFQISCDRGMPMQKIYEGYNVTEKSK